MTTLAPLAGLRVLDLTAMPPGGYCTVQLADLGAEVVRIEPPGQAGKPSLVAGQVGLSRGKRSITLDQRHTRSNDILRRLARDADILVENAKPGAMDSRGFGYTHAREEAPRLIWCSITGFGQDGPYADRSGHDLSYTGASGLLGALAPELPWHPGAMLAVPIGAMAAVSAILAAVIERGKTDQGCHIDISLAEAATWLLSGWAPAFKPDYQGIGAPADRRLYRCADGRFISVAAAEPRTWKALCDGLGDPALIDKPIDIAARLEAIFANRSATEWVELLGPLGAAVNPVHQGPDLLADPHVRARGSMREIGGEPVPASPLRLTNAHGETTTTNMQSPPLVGADTGDVLASAGYSAAEIASLRADAVI